MPQHLTQTAGTTGRDVSAYDDQPIDPALAELQRMHVDRREFAQEFAVFLFWCGVFACVLAYGVRRAGVL